MRPLARRASRLVLLAAAAALLAMVVNNRLAAALHTAPTRTRVAEPRPLRLPSPARVDRMASVINDRHIFDSQPPPRAAGRGEGHGSACGHDPTFVRPVGPHTFAVNRDAIRARLHAIRDLCRSSDMRAEPHGGADVIGYRIWSRRDDAFMRRMGLCDGDILLAVGDRRLTDPVTVHELFDQLERAAFDRMTLRLLRDRRPITLTWITERPAAFTSGRRRP